MSPEMIFRAIIGFRLVTADPARLAVFYRAIGFDVGEAAPIPASEMELLGLRGGAVATFPKLDSVAPGEAACDLVTAFVTTMRAAAG